MALDLQKRDCGMFFIFNPVGQGRFEFVVNANGKAGVLIVDINSGSGLNELLGALYYFLPDGGTDGRTGEGAEYVQYKYIIFNKSNGVKKIADHLDESDKALRYEVYPWRSEFVWKGPPEDPYSFVSWTLERPHDDSTEFQVWVSLDLCDIPSDDYTPLRFEIAYEDLCYAVAKACTELLKFHGVMGYHFSMEHGDINIRYLLYVKAIALGHPELCQLTHDKRYYGGFRSNFDDELRLLYFDM